MPSCADGPRQRERRPVLPVGALRHSGPQGFSRSRGREETFNGTGTAARRALELRVANLSEARATHSSTTFPHSPPGAGRNGGDFRLSTVGTRTVLTETEELERPDPNRTNRIRLPPRRPAENPSGPFARLPRKHLRQMSPVLPAALFRSLLATGMDAAAACATTAGHGSRPGSLIRAWRLREMEVRIGRPQRRRSASPPKAGETAAVAQMARDSGNAGQFSRWGPSDRHSGPQGFGAACRQPF